ncbi:hypothetical protein PPL_09880 [Heterostelium album PN500]|uniref:Ankyrin repeat protein n=1 Tax=Heterostelium pallidum (strain ATCC 26659 / Pp 5 / PN500) TaxID=670386 RepID=D3BPB5_HETP5|nr:hypothetical protein PPL_09880 [Heterostelium album PN500]EFA77125.1 hypothetical protein PPL_09880 [Heterostelium album PN500]|eukprot:XP_020429254.1 hypothetical protein PPL_09880 [Heterostelium album PN500]
MPSSSLDNNYNLLKKIINSLYLRDKIFSFVKLIHKNHKNVYQSPIQITGLGWYDIGCFPDEMIKYNQKERYKNIFNTVIRDRDYNDDTIAKFKELYLKSTVKASELGHLDLIEFIHQALPNKFSFKSIFQPALEEGHLSILQFIHQHKQSKGLYIGYQLLRAAELGYLDIVKFIHENKLDTPDGHPLKSAIKSKNLEVVKYIHSNYTDACRGILGLAISGGCLDIVQFLFQNRSTEDFFDLRLSEATTKGHLSVIKYLIENKDNFDIELPDDMLDYAAYSGKLELVQYLHENTTANCSTNAIDHAATNGYFEMLKYLHYNRSEGCTVAAMNKACIGGHLEIIKFLHYNRSEGCTDEAMYNACIGGHLETAKFLNENRTEGCNADAKYQVSMNGHFETYRYLHSNKTDQDDYPILDNFAGCDDPTALQWLKENTTNELTKNSYMIAIKNGKLFNFKWIKENTTLPIPFDALDEAAKKGRLDFVEYLHSIGANCSTSAMDETNNFEILKFLYFNRTEGCTHMANERAIKYNDIHSIKFLHQNIPSSNFESPPYILKQLKKSQSYGYISRLKLIKELKL